LTQSGRRNNALSFVIEPVVYTLTTGLPVDLARATMGWATCDLMMRDSQNKDTVRETKMYKNNILEAVLALALLGLVLAPLLLVMTSIN
jgi:hypothetical protein